MKAHSVSSGQLTGPGLLVGRGLWLVVAFLTVGLFIIAVPPRFEQLQAVCAGAPCQQPSLSMEDIRVLQGLGLSRSAHAVYSLALELVFAGLNFLIAAIIFARRSSDRIALLVALLLMTFGPATFTGTLNALAAQSSGWQLPMGMVSSLPGTLPDWLLHPLSPWRLPVGFVASVGQVCFALFFFLFPDGRFLPRWGLVPVALWIGGQVPAAFFPASFFNPANWPQSLAIAVWVSYLACFAYAQIYRYRHVSDTVERQQTKWVVFGITAAVAGFFLVALLAFILAALGLSGVLFREVVLTAIYLAMLLLPLSFAFAILRSRLWDIDLIINRSLVYVPLTAILAGLFAALITFSQKLAVAITGQEADAATVLTTLVVVAAFTPVKDHLQALVDKRFKETSEAGKRLNAFADKVHFRLSAVDPQQLSRRFLDEAVAAFQAKGGAVHLEGRGTWSPISTVGEWNGEAKLSVPVETGAMSFGLISLTARSDGREYSAHDLEILQHAASVVALAIQQDQTAESFSPI